MLESVLVWFRRDLRNRDHAALAEATRRARRVFCAFVFDRDLAGASFFSGERRVKFIGASLLELEAALNSSGSSLIALRGNAVEEIPRLANSLGVSAVFANRDYDPSSKHRDACVGEALTECGVRFELFKDHALFEYPEIATLSGRPFTVFTPFKKAWLKRLTEDDTAAFEVDSSKLVQGPCSDLSLALAEIGYKPTPDTVRSRYEGASSGMSGAQKQLSRFRPLIDQYHTQRDYPALDGVSHLSIHLRFGTISIRELVSIACSSGALAGHEGPACWLGELIWRDFFFAILDCFPHVVEQSFKREFDRIVWATGETADALYAAWCAGNTGFPLIDAAMRQLNSSGYMHNRLRMVTASFLVKDLGINWRRGEAYFAEQLSDYDLSANNGGWQWAASSGCDAQPYFRIFNPVTQSRRFDPQGLFIRRYLPELREVPDKFIHAPWEMPLREQETCGVIVGLNTPTPCITHDEARRQTLERYKTVRNELSV